MKLAAMYGTKIVASSEDRDTWLTARANGVTATNAAKLTNESQIDLIVKSKFFDSFTGNAFTDWGLEREPFLVSWAGFENNKFLFASSINERFMATPDGVRLDDDGMVELCQVKTTSKPRKKIPADHYRQVQWEMFVMGAVRCHYVVEQHENFVPVSLEPSLEIVERDDEVIASLVKMATVLLERLDDAKAFEKEME